MTKENVTDDLLVGYALGRLSDEQQEAVEEKTFSDRQVFERLQVVEDELIDRYASGRLTQDERERFEKYFLQSHEDRQRVEFARELAAVVSKESRSPRAEESPAKRTRRVEFLRIKNPWVLLPLAATLLLALGALWLIFHTVRLNNRLQQTQAQRDVEEKRGQELEEQLTLERRRSQQLAEDLERERRQSEEQIEPTPGSSARSIISFILVPGALRDRGSAPKLVIPAEAKQVRLTARFKTGDYSSYRAELQTVDGHGVWERSRLTARKQGNERVVSLSLPASVLGENDYILILNGVTSAGQESVAEYYFRTVRK